MKKNPKIQEEKAVEINQRPDGSILVYDEEVDDFVQVSKEQQMLAIKMDHQVSLGHFISAVAYKKIRDDKLFLGLGFSSFREYCEVGRGQHIKVVQRQIRVLEKFEKFLPELESGFNKNNNLSGTARFQIVELGFSKLRELATLEDEKIEELATTGALQTPDGGLSIEDIQRMTSREFTKQLAEIKRKHAGKIAQLDEENKQLKEERKLIQKQLEHLQQKMEQLRDLERKYGAKGSTIESKRMILETALASLANAEQYIFQIGLQEDDPISLHSDMANLIRRLDEVHKRAVSMYGFVVEVIDR